MDIKIENRVKEKLAAAVLLYAKIALRDPELLWDPLKEERAEETLQLFLRYFSLESSALLFS